MRRLARRLVGAGVSRMGVVHNAGASTTARRYEATAAEPRTAPFAWPALDRAHRFRDLDPDGMLESIRETGVFVGCYEGAVWCEELPPPTPALPAHVKNITLKTLTYDDVLEFGGGDAVVSFLGVTKCEDATPVFAADFTGCGGVLPAEEPVGDAPQKRRRRPRVPPGFLDLRMNNPFLSRGPSAVALYAHALTNWQRASGFCSKCGSMAALTQAGHQRKCTGCGAVFFPRQDPAMIVLVVSSCGEHALLGRQEVWPAGMHSTLAGFVEVGETFEDAVVREVCEEVGVDVPQASVRYVKSQPWPFPQSCMIGFVATADRAQPLAVDTSEVEAAAWFSKDAIREASRISATMDGKVAAAAAAAAGHGTPPLLIPPRGTIARDLIDGWLAGEA